MGKYFVVRAKESKEFAALEWVAKQKLKKERVYNHLLEELIFKTVDNIICTSYAIFPSEKDARMWIKAASKENPYLKEYRMEFELVEVKLAPQFIREVEW